MKPSLAATAAVAAACAASAASAQSSILMFGVVDTAIGTFSSRAEPSLRTLASDPAAAARGAIGLRRNAMINSGHNSSRFGFRGTEDLGGGLAASFWLEAPISNDDGQTGIASFSRRSTVSPSGGFGEIRLGRDYTPTFWNDSVMDPFGQVGPGTNLLLAASTSEPGFGANGNYARVGNSVGYFLPKDLGGFYGQLMYGFHENTRYTPGDSTPPGIGPSGRLNAGAVPAVRAGRYLGGRFGYASGPLDIALAYSTNTVADSFYAGTTDSVRTANLGVAYDFEVAKLTAELSRVERVRRYAQPPAVGAVPDTELSGYLLGVQVPIGPGLFRASYARVRYDLNAAFPAADPSASKLAIGYVHNLSKRTALYVTAARVRNRNGAALIVGGAPAFTATAGYVPATSTGYVMGVRHAF